MSSRLASQIIKRPKVLKSSSVSLRNGLFCLFGVAAIALSWRLLSQLCSTVLQSGYGSYSVLIPLACAYIIWLRRQEIFSSIQYDPIAGLMTIGLSLVFALLSSSFTGAADSFPVLVFRYLALLFWLSGIFVIVYGRQAVRRALFPFVLLFLSVPLPAALAEEIISILQSTSTSLSYFLFSLLGTPVFREGFLLRVPGASIEVAKECSGINSSMALVFTVLLVGYETLRTPSRRLLLLLIALPLSIVKNAVRIVTLTLLAVHVDRSFLTGNLHHKGGVVFYLLMLAALYPVWKLLQLSEVRLEKSITSTLDQNEVSAEPARTARLLASNRADC